MRDFKCEVKELSFSERIYTPPLSLLSRQNFRQLASLISSPESVALKKAAGSGPYKL